MLKLQFFYYVPTIVLTFALGLIVFLNNRKKLDNVIFLCFSVSILLWLAFQFVADVAQNAQSALILIRLTVVASLLIGVFFVALIDALVTGSRSNRRLWLSLAVVALALMPVALLPSTVVAVVEHTWGVEAIYGWTYPVFLAYSLSVFLYTLYIAYLKRHATRAQRSRNQVRFVYSGIVATLFVNVLTNFVLLPFGLPQQLGVALGIVSVIFIVGTTAFAIVKHRLFNIRALVARSAAYVFSIAVYALIYGFATYGLTRGVLLRGILTTESSQQAFSVILAVGLAFTFPTIRRFFEMATDRIFYRDRYDPQRLVSDVGRILASEIRLQPLTKGVVETMKSQIHLTEANIVVLSQDGIYYQTHESTEGGSLVYTANELATIRVPVLITDELGASPERELMERHHIRAALTLKTHEAFVGYLLLGDKQSGDIYSDEDIQTLKIIADELAIAIQNARSYQEIQKFNETLREKIRQATKDLTHANHELKELDKAKDEFISMASHQLRTPLTAVRGYTSMVMEGDFGEVSKEQQETLKQSFDAATRMGRLVDDLLNVSRIQSGKFKIERTNVDLNKVLPEELALLSTTANTKNVTIHFNPPKVPVPILSIDEGKTRQALMNLMDNAIYYSSTVKTGGKVEVFLESDATHVSFRVVDNGIGVPKAQQAKLFQKFYRAPNAQKTRPDGTGLGLFLVGKVVAGQGGEIIFQSEEGKGSTFGFKLPLKPAGDGLLAAAPVDTTEAENKAVKMPAGPAAAPVAPDSTPAAAPSSLAPAPGQTPPTP